MTTPPGRWPGRMVTLGSGLPDGAREVWLTETPGSVPGNGDDHAHRDLVLCVHGMAGAATNWAALMAELAPDFDCAALDLPGSGHSAPPRSWTGYSITALARTVAALIEALADAYPATRPGGVHLVGNSMGGAVAVRVAASRPDLVRTLTLISPALPDYRPRRQTAHFPALALPLAGRWLARRFARIPAENRVAGVYDVCYYDPAAADPAQLALETADLRARDALGYDDAVIAGAARTLVAETLRPPRLSLWRAAGRITAPTLVTFGSHDQMVLPRLAARATRAFAAARWSRVLVLPLTGHIAQMERPALVARLFREMVAEASAQGDPAGSGNSGRRDPVDA